MCEKKNFCVLAHLGGTPQGAGPALQTQPASRKGRANGVARFYVQAAEMGQRKQPIFQCLSFPSAPCLGLC